ncbi:hypothetical protein MTO96_020781 [Rhipicephalus appendiculatus]
MARSTRGCSRLGSRLTDAAAAVVRRAVSVSDAAPHRSRPTFEGAPDVLCSLARRLVPFRAAAGVPQSCSSPPTLVEFSSEAGAVLPCSAHGQPPPNVRWEKEDGSSATTVPGLRETRSDGSLVFPAFSGSQFRPEVHTATYCCVASNGFGLVKSRLAHVRGVVLEKFVASVYDVYVVRGNSALLRCHVPPAVRDYVTGVVMGLDSRYFMLPSGELMLRNAESTDSQRSYRCQVHNRLTEPHSLLPPRMTEYRSSVRVEKGERAVLPCLAQGHPPPKHRWFRISSSEDQPEALGHGASDGLESALPVMLSDTVILLPGGPLLLHAAGTQDNGRYLCVANNSAGEDRAHTDLLVTVPLSARIDPSVQVVDVGRSANLSCRVAGHPVHGVVWTHNGRTITPSYTSRPPASSSSALRGSAEAKASSATGLSRIAVLSRDTLHITGVNRQDRGMYQCLVYNERDSAQGSAQLVIGGAFVPSRLAEDAPVFEHVFTERQARPGTTVSLRCSASGNPLPQVTWSLDGAPVPEHYHVRIGDYVSGERLVHSYINMTGVRVEDGGLYSCVARNGVGRVSHTARLNVLGKPLIRPMANVTGTGGTHNAATLRHGRSLPQNHRQHSFPNGSLVVAEVQRSVDSGWYACVAKDPQGNTARGQLAVHVMTPPVVSPFSFPDDLTEGKRAGAACIVSDGDLPITIEWFKDGRPLDAELEASVAKANDYTSFLSFTGRPSAALGQLHLRRLQPGSLGKLHSPDAGTRWCPPRWRQEPVDKATIMGQAVTFDCQADGFPVPVIRWKKANPGSDGGRQFSVIISNANVQILENGSLSIREADTTDAAHYMCQALNGVGPGISTVVKLEVHVAAHFERKFQALTVRRGESVALTCRAVGEPPITVTWTRDRHAFSPSAEPRYVVEEKPGSEALEYVVRIPSVDRRDSSLFSCYAENTYGRDDTNFQVVVQGGWV